MEKYIREEIEKNKVKEMKRQEQLLAREAGGWGGGEVASAAAKNQSAPGPAGDPARDAGLDQVGTNVQEIEKNKVKEMKRQEQLLAGGAGGQGGGEAAPAAVQTAPGPAGAAARDAGLDKDKVVKKEKKNKMAPGQAGAPARDAGQDQEGGKEDSEDLSTLTPSVLRARCRERGLPSKGNKADLLVRLRGPGDLRPLPQMDGMNDEDEEEVEEEEVDKYTERLNSRINAMLKRALGGPHPIHGQGDGGLRGLVSSLRKEK
jgi:hypothetical protein